MSCDTLGLVGFLFLVLLGITALCVVVQWVYRVTSAVGWLKRTFWGWPKWSIYQGWIDIEASKLTHIDTIEVRLESLEARVASMGAKKKT